MDRIAKLLTVVLVSAMLMSVAFISGFVAHGYMNAEGNPLATLSTSGTTASQPATDTHPDNFDIFWEAWNILTREFYGDLPQGKQVTYAAIRGVLATLDDPNTILVEPQTHKRQEEQLEGEYGGIGAFVSTNDAGDIIIVSPIDDTPASRAGLQADDVILEVDGESIAGMDLTEAVELIKGPVGTEVTLTILRAGEEEPREITLTRERIPDPTVDHRMIEGTSVGYIRISFFSARTPDELATAINDLNEQGMEQLILDLRSNPGGLLDSAIKVASEFIGDGVIAYQQMSNGDRKELTARRGGAALDIPLVVLVNDGSASASEIVAGAIQDRGRGTLIGRQTFGKGTVQIPFELSDGASLHVTIAHWLTPDETDINEGGLEPDIWVELEEGDQQFVDDSQIDRAVEYLQTEE